MTDDRGGARRNWQERLKNFADGAPARTDRMFRTDRSRAALQPHLDRAGTYTKTKYGTNFGGKFRMSALTFVTMFWGASVLNAVSKLAGIGMRPDIGFGDIAFFVFMCVPFALAVTGFFWPTWRNRWNSELAVAILVAGALTLIGLGWLGYIE